PSYNAQAAIRARQSKFGLSIEDGAARIAADEIGKLSALNLTGLHCHLGSQITDEDAFTSALEKVLAFAAELRERHALERINIGGGFGVPGIRRKRQGPLQQMLALHGVDALTKQSGALDLGKMA